MSLPKIVILLLLACMGAGGQVLFKMAAQSIAEPIELTLHTLIGVVFNPYFLASIVIFGFIAIAWVLLLRDTELGRSYLMVALSIVLISVAGSMIFGEPLTARQLFGTATMIVGAVVAVL